MGRGNTDLSSNEYDRYLASKNTRSAIKELQQRHTERKYAHDANGRGWHFGISDVPIKVESREEFRHELNKRGLMMHDDVQKKLK